MQRYIEQVIEDLQEAKKNVPADPELGTEDSYEEFAEKMFAIETAPSEPSKNVFGVSYEELPPPEKLTEPQMQQLIDAIEDTLYAFNASVDYKNEMPVKLKYEVLRDWFEEDVHIMPGFTMHLDFCDGWCPDCKIVDYCDSVDELWTKEELEEERRKIKKEEKKR